MKPQWHENLIIICEKCGTKLHVPGKANPSQRLKDWLKKQLQEKSLWGTSRVITGSCLDICPEGKIAVAYLGDRPGETSFVEEVDPEAERERVLSAVIQRSRRSGPS